MNCEDQMQGEAFSFNTRAKCRICNSNLESLWDLGNLALTGQFVEHEEDVHHAPIIVTQCTHCSLVQLGHDYSMGTFFGKGYGYRSGLNRSMVNHLRQLAYEVENSIGLKTGDIVVDIGGNDGTTLSSYSTAVKKIIIDPTANNWTTYIPKDIHVIPEFFNGADQLGGESASLITTISMLYDLPDPHAFLINVYNALKMGGHWLCEQSDLDLMIQNNSFDTICHEHIEYYSSEIIVELAESIGFKLINNSTNNANGGSRRLLFIKTPTSTKIDYGKLGRRTTEQRIAFSQLVQRTQSLGEKLKKVLSNTRHHGLGASTKGNTILQVLKISRDELPFIAEVNPEKFGKFTPGTRIPIISEAESFLMRPEGFLVLPWHFAPHFLANKSLVENFQLTFPLPDLVEHHGA